MCTEFNKDPHAVVLYKGKHGWYLYVLTLYTRHQCQEKKTKKLV